MAGEIKRGRSTIIGNAGEYLLVGELLKRGIVAVPAPRNTPGFDVLATTGQRSCNIRVKTKTPASTSWVWMCAKDENRTIFKNMLDDGDFTVLVDLKGSDEFPDYFILPTRILNDRLKDGFRKWAESPGRGGRQRNPDSRMFRIDVLKTPTNWLHDYHRDWRLVLDYLGLGRDESQT
ncbi:MAG: hypothetical protein BZY81_03885 [SAR202 cluster bacterium Io17-Chloro-G4]|nr:MAG: hypothetical protein BZY81_03885 [SAR202 cluster bacterium Io17-Chloro-G4]